MTGKYDPTRHPDAIGALARRGLTDEQIAKELRISKKTLSQWKKDHVAVREASKEGKVLADSEVEKALYRRACGYTYTEKKVIRLPDGSTRSEITEKEIAPDPTSMIYWLKNRNPAAWRDVQQREITGAGGGPIQTQEIDRMTDEEVLAKAKKIMERRSN
jgi:transcriptional regulator with XRE-family HTH domain